jgi:hypothetical protein
VEAKNNQENDINIEEPARLDLELIAIGKRAGLSLEEINEFRTEDLLEYAEIYLEFLTGKRKQKTREATQADIDAFFG